MSKKTLITVLILIVALVFVFSNFAQAQEYGLEEAKNIQGLSTSEPEAFAGRLIKYALALVGVILIALIIYGGFMYATSSGNEEKIKTAKNVLVYAFIGVIIIALAWAITNFVLQALSPQPETEPGTPIEEEEPVEEEVPAESEEENVEKDREPDSTDEPKTYEYAGYKEPCRVTKGRTQTSFNCEKDLICNQKVGLCDFECAELDKSYYDLAGDTIKCCSSDLIKDAESQTCIKKQTRL